MNKATLLLAHKYLHQSGSLNSWGNEPIYRLTPSVVAANSHIYQWYCKLTQIESQYAVEKSIFSPLLTSRQLTGLRA
ncbi:MAG: hypothetical protein EOP45_05075 [Sphingobacteriaceae bacterium]|nr:MAG: hypothetical protein EOP45_05075 [Sphingobacteriaceae bacterium]